MKWHLLALFALATPAFAQVPDPKPTLRIAAPSPFQVIQRQSPTSGNVHLRGESGAKPGTLSVRLVSTKPESAVVKDWQIIPRDTATGNFAATITAPAGGWYRLEARLEHDGKTNAETAVEPIAIGEVFVVAGQSNSTNYGSKKQKTLTGMVSTFDGKSWRLANDPQPGVQDGSSGGSFLPAFGDALFEKLGVPIGVASTGAGATSVRQWLPRGERMKNQPTIASQIRQVGPGEWESTGALYDGLLKRIKALGAGEGERACRAILWHQGESDAGQARSGYPADRQITGEQYRDFMVRLIKASRKDAGWDVPWIVALATYHTEKDAADDEFRAAQKSLWDGKLAFEGPDSDSLRKEFRAGVHFNAIGLNAHGRLWAKHVLAFLDRDSPAATFEGPLKMDPKHASAFATLALKGLHKPYPNKPGEVLNSDKDVAAPRDIHPAFYGSYDWHSSVHGHWMLVRLLRTFPDLPEAKQIRAALAESLTGKNLKVEAETFARPNMQSWERPYGWAWLLKLAEELHGWDDADGKEWAKAVKPFADTIAARYVSYFPKQTYPIRSGVHSSTAFGLAFAHDYARTTGNAALRGLVVERAKTYYGNDADIPAKWEPDGADFFSPSLMEADLMRRVLSADEFPKWFARFLPALPKSLTHPATVTDRSDPQIVHLDGLNLSRAWCFRGIANALPKDDPNRAVLREAAERHGRAGLTHVASGDYAGEHWLASFAVYLLSMPE